MAQHWLVILPLLWACGSGAPPPGGGSPNADGGSAADTAAPGGPATSDSGTDPGTGTGTGDGGGDSGSAEAPLPDGLVVLDQVRVVDAFQTLESASVLVLGQSIHAVLAGEERPTAWPEDAQVLDLPGRTVIPGLIDSHVHLAHSGALVWVGPTLAENLAAQLAWGVVGVADLGGPEALFALRDALASGERVGPRIWATGPMLTAVGSHPCESLYDDQLCRFVDGDGAEAVAGLSRADGLKLALADAAFTPWPTPRLAVEDLIELTAAGSAAGQLVAVHVDTPVDAWDAADAGAGLLTHPVFSEDWGGRARPLLPVTSTLGVFSAPAELEAGDLLGEPLDWTPASVRGNWAHWRWRLDAFLPGWVGESEGWSAAARANVAARIAAGESVLAGSDAGYWLVPHGLGLHRELEALVDLGLSPQDALAAATSEPAQVFGWTDLGQVAAGFRASLVVLEADPLVDIRNTRRIEAVFVDGEVVAAESAGLPGGSSMCVTDDDCNGDERCDAFSHTCLSRCSGAYLPVNGCGPDAACLPADGLAGGDPVCRPLRSCDLYAQDCAPGWYGDACRPFDLDTPGCAPTGSAELGEACSDLSPSSGCVAGLVCGTYTGTCLALCDPAAATDSCSVGTCTVVRAGATPWYGLCL